jgi:hypothetical protein
MTWSRRDACKRLASRCENSDSPSASSASQSKTPRQHSPSGLPLAPKLRGANLTGCLCKKTTVSAETGNTHTHTHTSSQEQPVQKDQSVRWHWQPGKKTKQKPVQKDQSVRRDWQPLALDSPRFIPLKFDSIRRFRSVPDGAGV